MYFRCLSDKQFSVFFRSYPERSYKLYIRLVDAYNVFLRQEISQNSIFPRILYFWLHFEGVEIRKQVQTGIVSVFGRKVGGEEGKKITKNQNHVFSSISYRRILVCGCTNRIFSPHVASKRDLKNTEIFLTLPK